MLAIAKLELLIARRNMWVATSVVLMAMFSVVLTLAGGITTGSLGVDPLIVATSSITTLSVYFVPLVALLLSFDAISGEVERGTLSLSLTYPLSRAEILIGKFIAHFLVLAFAIGVGLLLTGILAIVKNGSADLSFTPLLWLFFTSLMLGATFLGLGYLVSALVRQPSVASGLAIVIWLVCVVLYDIALLGALVADNGGFFTNFIFPYLLVANPADAFRLLNMPEISNEMLNTGLDAASAVSGKIGQMISLFLWPILALFFAWLVLRKVET
jgi:Cu-processing system permease protein